MASNKRATESSMEELHGALCIYFLKLLAGEIPEMEKVKETDEETGETREVWKATGLSVRPSAGEVAVMAKFLKDNAITGAVAEGSALSDLQKKLAERHNRRGALPTARDVQDAMREIGSGLVQ